MRSLSDTLSRLKAMSGAQLQPQPADSRLVAFEGFGSNPGQLDAWHYVPQSAGKGAPLVVVLHGCTQNAAGYDRSTGWSRLADQHGFTLLFPEQQRSNNPNLCFNWFSPDDAARDKGEALSIRAMVAAVRKRHDIDPKRIFVTGLSAGGAMTAAMLATYPDVFAGGAVIAGLPFGVAHTVPEAFDRMRGSSGGDPATLAALVRSASGHSGDWPMLSVWHGSADRTVDPSNGSDLIDQWRILHDLGETADVDDQVSGYPHRAWNGPGGRPVIEEYVITDLAHGTPLDVQGSGHGEIAAPYMLEAGISSTRLIGQFWGLVPEGDADLATPIAVQPPEVRPKATAVPLPTPSPDPTSVQDVGPGAPYGQGFIDKTIRDALRSAGLLK